MISENQALGRLLGPPRLAKEVNIERRALRRFERLSVSLMEAPTYQGLRHGRQMMFDPKVRLALGVRNGFLALSEIEVEGAEPKVNRWVEQQWDTIWHTAAHALLKTKRQGFRAFEVIGKEVAAGEFAGWVGVKGLLDIPLRMVRALTADGDTVGFVSRRKQKLFMPKALWTTFDSEHGEPYPVGLLERAYPHWYQKWAYQGTEEMAALYMARHAAPGDVAFYPEGRTINVPDGSGGFQQVPWRDALSAMLEGKQSFSSLVLPRVNGPNGEPLTDYIPPTNPPAHNPFEWYNNETDLKILESMGIFGEVVAASETGSGFSGRSIPLMAMLSGFSMEMDELVREVDRQVIRPIAHLNIGHRPEYTIKAKSLVETVSDEIGDSSMAGGTMQGNPAPQPSPFLNGGGRPIGNAQQFADVDATDPEINRLTQNAQARAAAILKEAKADALSALKKKRGSRNS